MIQDIVDSVDTLSPFPPLARRAIEIATDGDAGIDELVDLVQFDPAVTSNCLKLCNSSYFGLREKVGSLKQALVMLGMRNLVQILLANCIKLPEYDGAHTGYGLHEGALWRHSVSCALFSGRLSDRANLPDAAVAFTAALLHDVGKLVLDRFLEERYRALCDLIQNRLSLIQAEAALFGIHHAELGGMIAESWNFPEVLAGAIRGHHRPMGEADPPGVESATRLCNIVSHVAACRSACFHLDSVICRVDERVLAPFGLNGEDIETMIESHTGEMMRSEGLFDDPA